jgi:GNAT superfamily N-acetyltransferase
MSQRPLEARGALTAADIGTRVRLRSATPDDIDVLVPLINAAYDSTESHIFHGTHRTDRDDISKLIDGMIIAELDDRVAACIHIDASGDPAHYGLLAVDVSLRRSGLGSLLIDHAERAARSAGASAIAIEVVKQANLLPFYEQRGYMVTGETDGQTWNGGADWGATGPWQMVNMEKSLR